jgi:hypothetical protein
MEHQEHDRVVDLTAGLRPDSEARDVGDDDHPDHRSRHPPTRTLVGPPHGGVKGGHCQIGDDEPQGDGREPRRCGHITRSGTRDPGHDHPDRHDGEKRRRGPHEAIESLQHPRPRVAASSSMRLERRSIRVPPDEEEERDDLEEPGQWTEPVDLRQGVDTVETIVGGDRDHEPVTEHHQRDGEGSHEIDVSLPPLRCLRRGLADLLEHPQHRSIAPLQRQRRALSDLQLRTAGSIERSPS